MMIVLILSTLLLKVDDSVGIVDVVVPVDIIIVIADVTYVSNAVVDINVNVNVDIAVAVAVAVDDAALTSTITHISA